MVKFPRKISAPGGRIKDSDGGEAGVPPARLAGFLLFESFKNVGKPSETMGKPEKTWENQKETMGKRGKTIRNMQKPWVLTKNGDSMVHFQ